MTTKPIDLKTRHILATEAINWTKAGLTLEQIGNKAIVMAMDIQSRGIDAIVVLRTLRAGFRLAGNGPAVDYINCIIHDALWADEYESEPMWT